MGFTPYARAILNGTQGFTHYGMQCLTGTRGMTPYGIAHIHGVPFRGSPMLQQQELFVKQRTRINPLFDNRLPKPPIVPLSRPPITLVPKYEPVVPLLRNPLPRLNFNRPKFNLIPPKPILPIKIKKPWEI